MKALVWHARKDIRVEKFPDPPPPKEGEVTIKIDWCGFCGTDVEEYRNGPLYIPVNKPNPLTGAMAPLVLGHEMVGTIQAVGKGVTQLKPGDRVSPDPIIFCKTCSNCLTHNTHHCVNMAHLGLTTHGGFAEYVNTIEEVCFKLPDSIPSEFGALSEPAAVCVRANRKADINIGHSVAIVGAGTIGLLALQLAKLSGAYPIYVVERSQGIKMQRALELGADEVIDSGNAEPVEALRELTNGAMVDRVIECGGNEVTMKMAVELCSRRGKVVITGLHDDPIGVNYFPVVWDEIEIIGSFSHIYDLDYKIATELIQRGMINVEALITGRISLDNVIAEGVEEFMNNGENHIKILASPHLM